MLHGDENMTFTYRSSSQRKARARTMPFFVCVGFCSNPNPTTFYPLAQKNPRDFEVENGSASIDSAIESILGW
jgi:hypothetical protein